MCRNANVLILLLLRFYCTHIVLSCDDRQSYYSHTQCRLSGVVWGITNCTQSKTNFSNKKKLLGVEQISNVSYDEQLHNVSNVWGWWESFRNSNCDLLLLNFHRNHKRYDEIRSKNITRLNWFSVVMDNLNATPIMMHDHDDWLGSSTRWRRWSNRVYDSCLHLFVMFDNKLTHSSSLRHSVSKKQKKNWRIIVLFRLSLRGCIAHVQCI